jgi:cytochrome c-type biogenesis protein CcmH
MERNDPATAAALWTRFRSLLPPDSPQLAQVDSALARLGTAAAAQAATPATAQGTGPAPAQAAPSAAAPGAASVAGRVGLDPKLAGSVAPGDTVFIFARDPEGPKMPLAAMKIRCRSCRRYSALTDAMAMSPAATISRRKPSSSRHVSASRVTSRRNPAISRAPARYWPRARAMRVTIDRVIR